MELFIVPIGSVLPSKTQKLFFPRLIARLKELFHHPLPQKIHLMCIGHPKAGINVQRRKMLPDKRKAKDVNGRNGSVGQES